MDARTAVSFSEGQLPGFRNLWLQFTCVTGIWPELRQTSAVLLATFTGTVAGHTGRVLPDPFEDLCERRLIHRLDSVVANPVDESGNGRFFDRQPVTLRRQVNVAQTDLLRRQLQARAAVRAFALLDKALLVEQKEAASNHYGTLR